MHIFLSRLFYHFILTHSFDYVALSFRGFGLDSLFDFIHKQIFEEFIKIRIVINFHLKKNVYNYAIKIQKMHLVGRVG